MTDPFQNVDAAGAAFIKRFADTMDVRQAEPAMEQIVARYLSALTFSTGGLTVEVGAGAGAVSRRIATYANNAKIVGFDPSRGFIKEARSRAAHLVNLTFEVADGAALPLPDNAAENVVLHTVLSHVIAPQSLVTEAARVLKPGGRMVICDAEFSKGSLRSFANDPLETCAREFVDQFVTDAFITGKLRQFVADAGLKTQSFDVASRVVTQREGMLAWVELSAQQMVDRGDIGAPLGAALCAEYDRRAAAGVLYGYQAFATVIAAKP